jgi:membrane-bound lytic murein transglycosylase D
MKYFVTVLILLFFIPGYVAYSQQMQPANETTASATAPVLVFDDPMIAALDSLSNLKYFENSQQIRAQLSNNKYNFLPNFVPSYPDSVYYYRLQRLDVESPISLTYNIYVKNFIDLYANRRRALMERVMGLSQIYFPMFEQKLDQYSLPLELKYLAIVESALRPDARSRVGASGLWQFMYGTGKVYGLEVSSYVDDRCDPVKSTVAACRHFRDLYNIYNDWLLVLAAYNSGPGNVNKAIRRSGGKRSFWEIRPYLPAETRDYVPAFIAVNYVMHHASEHNLYPVMPRIVYHEIDTVAVRKPLNFAVLSEKLKIPKEDLEFLNPGFLKDYIPATELNPYYIRLPQRAVADFVNNEQSLYAFYQLKPYEPSQVVSTDEPEYILKKKTHKVRKGETIASVAHKYHCTTGEIKRWNRMRSSKLKYGQNLAIYTRVKNPDYAASLVLKTQAAKTEKQELMVPDTLSNAVADTLETDNEEIAEVVKPAQKQKPAPVSAKISQAQTVKPLYHIVKKGEYLSKIATIHHVSVNDIKEWNNLSKATVFVGQKLRVNAPGQMVTASNNPDTTLKETPAKKIASDKNTNVRNVTYTVQAGDTLWSIAQKYDGVTVEQIKKWNNISKANSIKVGQKIKVILPGG